MISRNEIPALSNVPTFAVQFSSERVIPMGDRARELFSEIMNRGGRADVVLKGMFDDVVVVLSTRIEELEKALKSAKCNAQFMDKLCDKLKVLAKRRGQVWDEVRVAIDQIKFANLGSVLGCVLALIGLGLMLKQAPNPGQESDQQTRWARKEWMAPLCIGSSVVLWAATSWKLTSAVNVLIAELP